MARKDNPRDSKIEVALKLLEDANLERLEQFGKQFNRDVDRLSRALGSSGGGYGPTWGGSGPSPTASVAGPSGSSPPTGGPPIPPVNLTPPPPGGGGGQPGFFKGRFQGSALANPYLNPFERGKIRLGDFPGFGASQALYMGSYLAGMVGWRQLDPQDPLHKQAIDDGSAFQGEDGHYYMKSPDGGMQGLARGASEALGFAGQTTMRMPQVIEKLRGLVQGASGLNYAVAGQQSGGFSRSGGIAGGFPIFGGAYMHGVGMNVKARSQSWLGFNPNYSYQQAQEAQQAIAGAGYWGQDADYLASQMRSFSERSLMNPNEVIQLMDPIMRFLGSDQANPQLAELSTTIKNLGDVSKAAHIGLSQLGSSLASTAAQLISSTGMVNPAPALAALSATTRMDPSALAQMFSGHNLIMGAAMTGQHLSDVMANPGQGVKAATKFPMMVAHAMMGNMSIDQFQKLQRQNSAAAKSILDRMWYAYESNPNIFGGMSPTQVLNQMAKGVDPGARAQAFYHAQVGDLRNQTDALKMISEFGGPASKTLRQGFLQHFGNKNLGNQDERNDARKWLVGQMTKAMDTSNNKAANRVELILDPWARKLVQARSADAPNSNKGSSWWHKAIDVGGGVLADAGAGAAGFVLSGGNPLGAVAGVAMAHESGIGY